MPTSIEIVRGRDKDTFKLNGRTVFKITYDHFQIARDEVVRPEGERVLVGEGLSEAEAAREVFRALPQLIHALETDALHRLSKGCRVALLDTELTNRVRTYRDRHDKASEG